MSALTAREQALVEGFRWLATVTHQAYHEGELRACSKRTCQYALEIIDKAGKVEEK